MNHARQTLCATTIHRYLKNNTIIIQCHEELTSTMDTAQTNPPTQDNPLKVTLAHTQTQGRGQHNKTWQSPKGQGLYMTLSAHNLPQENLKILSLSTGIALLEACITIGIPPEKMSIKWPNDLMIEHKKVAGILIESTHTGTDSITHIGIGSNLYPIEDTPNSCALSNYLDDINPNQLATEIIQQVMHHIQPKTKQMQHDFLEKLQQYDALRGHDVTIETHKTTYQGRCMGVDPSGALRLQTHTNPNEILLIHTGQLTQHPFQGRAHA